MKSIAKHTGDMNYLAQIHIYTEVKGGRTDYMDSTNVFGIFSLLLEKLCGRLVEGNS